jgi:hypothetical protein
MFSGYRPPAGQTPDAGRCFLQTFRQGVRCSATDARNWGDPASDGYNWQAVTKHCPAFSTEYGAVVLRTHGGLGGEFGPINCYVRKNPRCRKPSLYPACDAMFSKVQAYVKDHPDVCAALK